MATYLALDIEVGPCLDQQAHAAVFAFDCGLHERRLATLYHEWTWGATEVRVNHRVGGGAEWHGG